MQRGCCDEINGCNGLVQMEDRGGQGELGRKMKTITVLHPTGVSGERSEVAMLGRHSYPKPCWLLNSERWYQPLLPQTSSLITPCILSLSLIFILCIKAPVCISSCRCVCQCLYLFNHPESKAKTPYITLKESPGQYIYIYVNAFYACVCACVCDCSVISPQLQQIYIASATGAHQTRGPMSTPCQSRGTGK